MAAVIEDSQAKYIYFDIWATWCGPCIKEFAHTSQLKDYVKAHPDKIEVIYITIDEKKPISSIEKVINFNKLDGKHILASEDLRKEIIATFGNGDTINIPAYFIMDKDNVVVNKNASRPSHWEALKAELERLE